MKTILALWFLCLSAGAALSGPAWLASTAKAAAATSNLKTSLIAVWEMDTNSVCDQPDILNGHTLTQHGNVQSNIVHIQGIASAQVGGALNLDTASADFTNNTHSFSVAMWFCSTNNANENLAILARWNATPAWVVWVTAAPAPYYLQYTFRNAAGDGNVAAAISTVAVNNNAWHLLVATYNASTSVAQISVDGETFVQRTTEGMRASADYLTFANFTTGSGSWVGIIDETCWWDQRVLSQSDVAEIWASGAGKFYAAW